MNDLSDAAKTALGIVGWVFSLTLQEWSVVASIFSFLGIGTWMFVQVYYKRKEEARKDKDDSESGE